MAPSLPAPSFRDHAPTTPDGLRRGDTLYRRTGKREQEQKHFTTATTMYREMGMTYWLEQAEAEIG